MNHNKNYKQNNLDNPNKSDRQDRVGWNDISDDIIKYEDKKIGPSRPEGGLKHNPENQNNQNNLNNLNNVNNVNNVNNPNNQEDIDKLKCTDFEQMNLKVNLLRGVYSYGFEKPSRIQQCTIPIILSGKDIIAQSHSGTGKTGAFTIATLQLIDETKPYPQAIIMTPTRELSQQIESVIIDLSKYTKTKTALCVGGINVEDNIKQARDAHIVIGTPGRMNDLMERRTFHASNIKILVLDEADELLQREFIMQTRNIVKKLNSDTQICAFSATLKEDSLNITSKFMNNPVNLLIEKEKLSLKEITQYYIDVGDEKYKLESLNDLYNKLSIGQCIIYVNYKEAAVRLRDNLIDCGHSAIAIHGSLTAVERTDIMKKFRSGEYRVLISTDLLARGIDIQQVGYVINYDLPTDLEAYIHRIGRSGRFGKKGVSINFITRRDIRAHRNLQQHYGIQIEEMPDPDYLNEFLKSN